MSSLKFPALYLRIPITDKMSLTLNVTFIFNKDWTQCDSENCREYIYDE